VYTQSVCPTVITSADASTELFLRWNGESLTSGQITGAVQSIWKQAGLETANNTEHCEENRCVCNTSEATRNELQSDTEVLLSEKV